jgi:hypothetical protein
MYKWFADPTDTWNGRTPPKTLCQAGANPGDVLTWSATAINNEGVPGAWVPMPGGGGSFSITSFTGGEAVEIGATVTDPTFDATYSSLPTSAEITNTDGAGSPLVLLTPFTSGTVPASFVRDVEATVTFTLTAVGSSTQTATQAITWEPRMFAGVGGAGATGATASGNNANLVGASGTLANAGLSDNPVGQTYDVSPAAQKVYLLLTGGSHTFRDTLTGFPFAMNAPTPIAFVNQNGQSVAMYLYESTNILTSIFDILVVS